MPPSTSSGGVEMSPDKRQYKSTRKKVAEMEFIPHDLDVDATIEQVDNFHPVHILDIRDFSGPEGTRKLKEYAEAWVKVEGKPLVLRNYHLHDTYPHHIFSPEWLIANHSRQLIVSRNLVNGVETQMSMGHYLKNMSKLTNTVIDADGAQVPQRLYAKDIDCPPIWKDKLKELLPRFTFYLEKSADLMVMLPPAKRAQNMLCYFGHEGTYTPAHKEMCGTVGHNLMVYSSTGENPGSSIWWMTKTEDRKKVADFWLELGHDIETEKHFTSLADWMDAPFPVYIHEQVEGDYILVPSMAPHQVWNRGVCTLKAAWNRVTVETLEYALSESLAKSRMVCRDEQYKCKAIVHETLREYARVLNGGSSDIAISQSRMESDFVRLFRLFDQMMLSECFAATNPPTVELLEMEDASVTCSFCRSDIWNRFLTCRSCAIVDEQETDCYDVCLDCYARGRSCYCVSGLNWVEQFRWSGLVAEHEEFRRIVVEIQNAANPHGLRPLALHRALKHLGRKTLAWVCQEQLEVRPYADPAQNGLEDEEGTDGDLALEKKRAGVTLNCHACKVQHDSWRVAKCSRCAKAYCYGNLWRGYDMDPFEDVLAVPQWICPVCLGICNCGACRRKGDMKPYQQVGTYLSKSTRAFSDPRSYEALVSFEKGNVVWREGNAKRKGAAEAEKTPVDPALGNSFPAVNTPARSLDNSKKRRGSGKEGRSK